MKVYATIPYLNIRKKTIEKKKEIYVVSFASDLRGPHEREDVLGANNSTLDTALEQGFLADYMHIGMSNTFHNIRSNEPLSLSGDGIVVYPPSNPAGMFGLHLMVVESDEGIRDLGKLLGVVSEMGSVNAAMDAVAAAVVGGTIYPYLLTKLFQAVTEGASAIMQNNNDDILFSHGHSGIDFNDYAGDPKGIDYNIGNRDVSCVLRVYAKE